MIDFNVKISVLKQFKMPNLSRNFIYYTSKSESEYNIRIMFLLDKKYFETPFYGYRKITVWLQNQGFFINEIRVKRLMKLKCWKTIYRDPKTTICNPVPKKYPYMLKNLKINHKVVNTKVTYTSK
jgi:putative transposase